MTLISEVNKEFDKDGDGPYKGSLSKYSAYYQLSQNNPPVQKK